MAKGCIYIMTNPCLANMVKIGYAADVEERRRQLSTTALPYPYEIFATYETPGKLEDKRLHKLIDRLNPDLRVSKNREFFVMSAEDAYELLEAIAIISGSQDKLKRRKPKSAPTEEQKLRRPPLDFAKCGIPLGAEPGVHRGPQCACHGSQRAQGALQGRTDLSVGHRAESQGHPVRRRTPLLYL